MEDINKLNKAVDDIKKSTSLDDEEGAMINLTNIFSLLSEQRGFKGQNSAALFTQVAAIYPIIRKCVSTLKVVTETDIFGKEFYGITGSYKDKYIEYTINLGIPSINEDNSIDPKKEYPEVIAVSYRIDNFVYDTKKEVEYKWRCTSPENTEITGIVTTATDSFDDPMKQTLFDMSFEDNKAYHYIYTHTFGNVISKMADYFLHSGGPEKYWIIRDEEVTYKKPATPLNMVLPEIPLFTVDNTDYKLPPKYYTRVDYLNMHTLRSIKHRLDENDRYARSFQKIEDQIGSDVSYMERVRLKMSETTFTIDEILSRYGLKLDEVSIIHPGIKAFLPKDEFGNIIEQVPREEERKALDDNKPRQIEFGARRPEVPSLIDSLEEYKLDEQLNAASQKLDDLAKLGYKSSEPPMKVFEPDEYKGLLDGVDLGKVDFDEKMDFSGVEIPPMPSTEEMRDMGKKAQELLNKNNRDKDRLLMLDEIERRRLQLEREAQERRERRK